METFAVTVALCERDNCYRSPGDQAFADALGITLEQAHALHDVSLDALELLFAKGKIDS